MSIWLIAFALVGACSSDAAPGAAIPPDPNFNPPAAGAGAAPEPWMPVPSEPQPPASQPSGLQPPALCMRTGDDAIRDLFCGSAPAIQSLRDLQGRLETASLAFDPNTPSKRSPFPASTTVAVLGHSTALSGQLVSPINPRVIVVRSDTIVTFQRGVQRLELIASDRTDNRLNFYLLDFQQACNASEHGCAPGELYAPTIEAGWTRVTLRDDEDLKNTPQDCRQCHQRATDTPTLLMRELQSPWTHFFFPLGSGGSVPDVSGADLMQEYVDAKGDEPYGGVSLDQISPASPFLLQGTVAREQPLIFDAPQIESERWPFTAESGYPQKPQPSPTWERGYEAFKRGEQLALPYLEQRASDLNKQRAITEKYRRFRAGEIEARDLPDMGDIFPDDPMVRARIGLQTEPGASAEDALIQACGACHNDVLDQTISRARFTIALRRLDRASLDRAIDRISLAPDELGVMPPTEARQLDDEARAKLIAYLRGEPSALDADGRLERAARAGMAGGGGTGLAEAQ